MYSITSCSTTQLSLPLCYRAIRPAMAPEHEATHNQHTPSFQRRFNIIGEALKQTSIPTGSISKNLDKVQVKKKKKKKKGNRICISSAYGATHSIVCSLSLPRSPIRHTIAATTHSLERASFVLDLIKYIYIYHVYFTEGKMKYAYIYLTLVYFHIQVMI